MKKCIAFFFIFLILTSFFACAEAAPENEWTVTDGITLRLVQDTYPVC